MVGKILAGQIKAIVKNGQDTYNIFAFFFENINYLNGTASGRDQVFNSQDVVKSLRSPSILFFLPWDFASALT
ncbi:MAG: hypothetical protein IPK46_22290 [Saprospiraceae bacterium]|nr:hypothetical protein [Saprospiraceae bacterium]